MRSIVRTYIAAKSVQLSVDLANKLLREHRCVVIFEKTKPTTEYEREQQMKAYVSSIVN